MQKGYLYTKCLLKYIDIDTIGVIIEYLYDKDKNKKYNIMEKHLKESGSIFCSSCEEYGDRDEFIGDYCTWCYGYELAKANKENIQKQKVEIKPLFKHKKKSAKKILFR